MTHDPWSSFYSPDFYVQVLAFFEPVDFAVGEITDQVSVTRALDGCDGVVHTAALVSLDPGQAELMHRTNVEGTRAVIGGAVERGIESIVYVSSTAALFDPALPKIDENTPLAAASTPYARSKADSARYVQQLIDEGAKIAITCPTGVVGPDDPAMSEGNMSLLFILNNCHVNTSGGLQVIDVRDLAHAHLRLLEGKKSGRYLAAGHYSEWRHFGDLLRKVTGRRLLALPVPGALMRGIGAVMDVVAKVRSPKLPISHEGMTLATRWVVCDDNKLREDLALQYRPLEETLADTVRWMADSGHVGEHWGQNLRV